MDIPEVMTLRSELITSGRPNGESGIGSFEGDELETGEDTGVLGLLQIPALLDAEELLLPPGPFDC